jgi:alkylation response protein AidB-like acyl-CoA dehydrogenase
MSGLDAFRAEVAAWFAEHTPADWVERTRTMSPAEYREFQLEWLAALNTRGYAAPGVDRRWGGGGFSAREQAVVYEEWANAEAPGMEQFVVSLHHVPGTFGMVGTPEQQERYIRPALNGEGWCQGFSEPGSGSDLASLRLPAVATDDGWEVTGQKIWTTNADVAKYCLLLARTDPESRGSQGISYFVLDMDQPGVEVRPIRQNTGYAEFCELFLDRARIPAENLIGEIGQGWAVAQRTLAAERGPAGFDLIARLQVTCRQIGRRLEADAARDGTTVSAAARRDLARLVARTAMVRSMALDAADALAHGADSGLASLLKLSFSELLHDIMNFATVALGADAIVARDNPNWRGFVSGDWTNDWLGSWGWTVSAGTNEIQRNIIAEKLLGLPREPKAVAR